MKPIKAQATGPIDSGTINENIVRLIAFQAFLLSIVYIFIESWIIPAFLTGDYFLRAFGFSRFSPLHITSEWLVSILPVKYTPMVREPKIFATQLAFVISDIFFIVSVLGLSQIAYGIDIVFLAFSFLESVLRFCAGCYIYAIVKKRA